MAQGAPVNAENATVILDQLLVHGCVHACRACEAVHVAYRVLPEQILCCWIKLLSTCMNQNQLVTFVDCSKDVLLQDMGPEVTQPANFSG